VLETDLIRGGLRTTKGFKERQTVTGVFNTLIYDLNTETIGSLQEIDQQTVRTQMQQSENGFTNVDTIRFIKTNKVYYDRVILLFLKFYTSNKARMQKALTQHMSSDEKVIIELQRYLLDGRSLS
jgi:hypothetical protein